MTTKNNEAEVKLEAAIAHSAEWRKNIDTMTGKLADAKAKVAEHEGTRRMHALDAELGKAASVAAMAKAHEEQAAAERRVADLEHALAEARPKLAQAQAEEGAARHAVRRIEGRSLVEKRVEAARAVDEAGEALEAALSHYYDLWDQLATISEIHPVGSGMSVQEMRRGDGRVRVSMPAILRRIFDVPGNGGSLARSEELTWRGALA